MEPPPTKNTGCFAHFVFALAIFSAFILVPLAFFYLVDAGSHTIGSFLGFGPAYASLFVAALAFVFSLFSLFSALVLSAVGRSSPRVSLSAWVSLASLLAELVFYVVAMRGPRH